MCVKVNAYQRALTLKDYVLKMIVENLWITICLKNNRLN